MKCVSCNRGELIEKGLRYGDTILQCTECLQWFRLYKIPEKQVKEIKKIYA